MRKLVNRKKAWTIAICVALALISGFVWQIEKVTSPSLPFANNNGSSQVFSVDETTTYVAIRNAFADGRYRNMMLDQAIGRDYVAEGWRPTNGLILDPVLGGITNVPLGNRWVPYLPFFHIVVTPMESNRTVVNVRTVQAHVIDGKRFGLMGWHLNYQKVHPVRQEEENVLEAISNEMAHVKPALPGFDGR